MKTGVTDAIAARIIGSAVALVQAPLRLLHARIGHVNAPQLVKGINTGRTKGIQIAGKRTLDPCDCCRIAKMNGTKRMP